MNSAQKLSTDLSKASDEDAKEAGTFRDNLRKGIEKSEQFLVNLADGTEAEVSKLTDDANDLSIQEKSEIRAVKRKGEELQDSLSKEVAESFQTQQELAESQQKKVMKKAQTGLEIDAKRNVEDLSDVEQGVTGYLKEKDMQIGHLQDQERLLKTDFGNMATKSREPRTVVPQASRTRLVARIPPCRAECRACPRSWGGLRRWSRSWSGTCSRSSRSRTGSRRIRMPRQHEGACQEEQPCRVLSNPTVHAKV